MTTTTGGFSVSPRCRYCWHPEKVTVHSLENPQVVGIRVVLELTNEHNSGCPDAKWLPPGGKERLMAEWDAGWSRGFADKPLPEATVISDAYWLGHRVGKNSLWYGLDPRLIGRASEEE